MRRMMWVHSLNELRLDKGEFYTLYPDLRHKVFQSFSTCTGCLYLNLIDCYRKFFPLIEKKWTNIRELLSAEHKLVLALR